MVNDGSTDRTEELCKKWAANDGRIKYIKKENGGLSSARNSGLENASSGDYIFFIDSDDTLTDNSVLGKFAAHLNGNPDVVTANINLEDEKGNLKPSKLNIYNDEIRDFTGEEVLKAYLEEKISAVAWNKLYRNDFLKKHDLKFENGLLHEDELWSLQVYLKAEKVKTLPDFTYNYFKGNSGAITANKNIKNYNSYVFIMKQIVKLAEIDEKLKIADKKAVIRLFEKQYYFLKNPAVIAHEKLWKSKYNEIRGIYRNSILNSYQKRFKYSAVLSYFATKRFYGGNKKSANLLLTKLITF